MPDLKHIDNLLPLQFFVFCSIFLPNSVTHVCVCVCLCNILGALSRSDLWYTSKLELDALKFSGSLCG